MKTEEGYSADIYPVRYMSALCPHNILRRIYVSRQGYMSALYTFSVFSSGNWIFNPEGLKKYVHKDARKNSYIRNQLHRFIPFSNYFWFLSVTFLPSYPLSSPLANYASFEILVGAINRFYSSLLQNRKFNEGHREKSIMYWQSLKLNWETRLLEV